MTPPSQSSAPLTPLPTPGLTPLPPFAGRLQEGERLLWQGTPDPRRFILPRVVAVSFFTLPLIPLLVLLEQWRSPGTLPLSSPITWAIGAFGWLAGCWVYSSEVRSQAQAAAYALTDRRILIRRLERLTSQDWRPRVDEIALTAIQPKLRLEGGGRGTITLGGSLGRYERALRGIADAAGVFALLFEARAALAVPALSGVTEGPYYAKAAAKATAAKPDAPGPFSFTDHLRAGETVSWEGGMDRARLWREERWGMTALIVVLSAAGGVALFLNGWWNPAWQALVLIGVAALGYWLAWGGCAKTARNRRYALTNQRVIVVKGADGRAPNVDERDLRETAAMKLKAGRDGFGTVIFEKKTRFVWHGQGGTVETYEFSFKHVADAQAVFARIQAARAEAASRFSPEENRINYFFKPPPGHLP